MRKTADIIQRYRDAINHDLKKCNMRTTMAMLYDLNMVNVVFAAECRALIKDEFLILAFEKISNQLKGYPEKDVYEPIVYKIGELQSMLSDVEDWPLYMFIDDDSSVIQRHKNKWLSLLSSLHSEAVEVDNLSKKVEKKPRRR